MVKMEFHFFVLFSKEIQMKILTFKSFQDFFNSAHFSLFKVDQIFLDFYRRSLDYKELGSVEIFRLSFMVPGIQAFTYLHF
jgi:hypothetical protein